MSNLVLAFAAVSLLVGYFQDRRARTRLPLDPQPLSPTRPAD